MKLPETVPIPLVAHLESVTEHTTDGPVLVVTATIMNDRGEPVSRGKLRFVREAIAPETTGEELAATIAQHLAAEVCESLAEFVEGGT